MKIFNRIICIASVLTLLWVGVSWMDIVSDNSNPNPEHNQYNAFVLMARK